MSEETGLGLTSAQQARNETTVRRPLDISD